ncbi:homodimeric glycerol 3-phosphate dehydrogenase (quinone) [Halopseudomonas xinjiangensis]|uniref:Glycerol-3-phosphate dehydrogenase n=1 Tax=Halopseudomonas xinjiangensis TaxID=487184 RepID=A0A1H1TIN2_9GAMM|nr:glycerol-3-phosphate dehydrogenase [Halopseudomonas xinjiangensis]SDS59806.1 homodimeric glycerol 3-phosphate dehydrogenase (quinone) [Halopseudomonas xinjiangensis]
MLEAHPKEAGRETVAEQDTVYDILVIGGGVNGVGIANDAAGRGLKVLLCEQHDLAAHTSSASSKLIHGGLRYLEHYEFRLVREALGEREVLLEKAPHIIWPLRFVLPHRPHLRPRWMLRAGLFLYDHLGKRTTLPGSQALELNGQGPLQASIRHAFEYSDCWVDDARLVVLNAMQARSLGADIHLRTRCTKARRQGGIWHVDLQDTTDTTTTVRARALVNASGPWAARVIERVADARSPHGVRLVQGSHIVVPRICSGEGAYILQNSDNRIVFVLPYEQQFSLIGTTDREYQGEPSEVRPSKEEEAYLIAVVNEHFKRQLRTEDICHRYAGVRPLVDDEDANPSAVTRDYTLTVQDSEGQAPLLSVFGGKLTTYRRLAESALERLKPWFTNMGPSWTGRHALPGGSFESPGLLVESLAGQYPWLDKEQLSRYVRSYGTLCQAFLRGCSGPDDLGEAFGGGLTEREVKYLREREWAVTSEDILWRRSKLGLHLNAAQQTRLAEYLGECQSVRSVE